jgi:hypothetical protein
MTNILAYSDGTMDLIGIAELTGISAEEAIANAARLVEAKLLTSV